MVVVVSYERPQVLSLMALVGEEKRQMQGQDAVRLGEISQIRQVMEQARYPGLGTMVATYEWLLGQVQVRRLKKNQHGCFGNPL